MPPPRVAVVGGGVSACSLAYALRDQLTAQQLSLTIFEMGRGPGGRAATRTTRERPELRVDHGAPSFAAHARPFKQLCDSLIAPSVLRPVSDTLAFGKITEDGRFVAEEPASAPARFAAADGKGMSALCDALLCGGDPAAEPLCERVFGTMVSQVESTADGGWRLLEKKGGDLGQYDWLVVTSTGLAHPRWRSTFGGEPPLVAAAAHLGDPALDATLSSLAPLGSKPVTACLLAYEGEAAAAWAAVPFYKTIVEGDEVLSRVVVQRGVPGRSTRTPVQHTARVAAGSPAPCPAYLPPTRPASAPPGAVSPALVSVVLHSTHGFARGAAHVYGKTSTSKELSSRSRCICARLACGPWYFATTRDGAQVLNSRTQLSSVEAGAPAGVEPVGDAPGTAGRGHHFITSIIIYKSKNPLYSCTY